jgi:hypothetical protein
MQARPAISSAVTVSIPRSAATATAARRKAAHAVHLNATQRAMPSSHHISWQETSRSPNFALDFRHQ